MAWQRRHGTPQVSAPSGRSKRTVFRRLASGADTGAIPPGPFLRTTVAEIATPATASTQGEIP